MSSLERTINKTQISFWQPIHRQRLYTSDLHVKIGEAFFDYVIDPLYTSPFASQACGATQWHRSIDPWCYTVTNRNSSVKRLPQLVRAVVVIAGLTFLRRMTVGLLVTGFAIKVLCRSRETYYIDTGDSSTRVSPPTSSRVSPEQVQQNLEKWAQKWWCDTMFYLFAIGSDDTITLPSQPSVEEDRIVEVYIGLDRDEYPLSFLNALPFFRVLMSSGMREVSDGTIHLTAKFPYKHRDLQVLKERLESTDATQYEDCSQHDFLCLGMRQDEAPHVWRLGEMQRIIADKDYAALKSSLPDEPPGVKIGSYTFEFLPEILRPYLNFEGKSDVVAKDYAIKCLHEAMSQEASTSRHYHVNRIVNEFVHHIYQINRTEVGIVDLITPLLEIFSHVGASGCLTVLELPPTVLENEDQFRLLPRLLGACPSLKWLSLDSYDGRFRIIDADDRDSLNSDLHSSTLAHLDQEQDLPEDMTQGHEGLRILKIEGQTLTPGQARRLRELFPNLDILEAQVLKIR